MFRTTHLSVLIVLAVAACSGRSGSQHKQQPDARVAAKLTPLEQAREKYLVLDAALAKLNGQIASTTDADALAVLRDKQMALEFAIRQARQQIELMEKVERERRTSPR